MTFARLMSALLRSGDSKYHNKWITNSSARRPHRIAIIPVYFVNHRYLWYVGIFDFYCSLADKAMELNDLNEIGNLKAINPSLAGGVECRYRRKTYGTLYSINLTPTHKISVKSVRFFF